MKKLNHLLLLLICCFGMQILAQDMPIRYVFKYGEKEDSLTQNLNDQPDSLKSNYELGMFYYNQGITALVEYGRSEVKPDSVVETVYCFGKAKPYLERALELDSNNTYVDEALTGIDVMMSDTEIGILTNPRSNDPKMIDSQAFRVIDGDTINKIDELGMHQGEWERIHPNGNFKCRGTYKDDKKDGYWERKYDNGSWQYQVHFKNGMPHGHGKWYYKTGQPKSEGHFFEGKTDGVQKFYYPDGTLKSVEHHVKGEVEGICKYYREDGTIIRSGGKKKEERYGVWNFFNEAGEKTTIVTYEKGVAVKTTMVD